jgi:hypothetical protein
MATPCPGKASIRKEKVMNHKRLVIALFVLLLIDASSLWASDSGSEGITVYGGGTSILTGGGPGTTPVTTKLGINFENGSGHFDCLALMPTPRAGTEGSGNFDKNMMYVTGRSRRPASRAERRS